MNIQLNEFILSRYIKGTIGGVNIYSFDTVENDFIEKINNIKYLEPIIDTINLGIKNNHILIGYQKRRNLLLSATKYRDSLKLSSDIPYFGFFSSDDNRIAIVLDKSPYINDYYDYFLGMIIAHELCHYVAKNGKYTYLKKLFMVFMKKFYFSLFYHSGAPIEDNRENEELLYSTLMKISRIADDNYSAAPMIKNIYGLWEIFLSKSTNLKDNEIKHTLLLLFFPYLSSSNFVQLTNKNIDQFEMGVECFDRAYQEINIKPKALNLLPGQEIIFPCEVMCVYSSSNLKGPLANLINDFSYLFEKEYVEY